MKSPAAILDGPVEGPPFTESRPATVEPIDVADPGPEEVRVEIEAASLCHTDLAIALGHIDEQHPLVMGHEGAGIVEDIGDGVTSVAPGDHVVLGRPACGTCEFCRRGRAPLCEARSVATRNGTLRTGAVRFEHAGAPAFHCHGVSSFTEFTVVDEEVAIRITDEVPLDRATLLGCGVFTGFGAVTTTANVEPGAAVAVFGAGGVGLSAVQAAVARAAEPVIAVDVVSEKLEVAAALGATHTIVADEVDPIQAISEIEDTGVDYAFDVVGRPTVTQQAIEVLRPTGTAVVVGIPPAGTHDIGVDIHGLVTGEKRVLGSFNGSEPLSLAIPRLADLAANGTIELDPLVTGTRPIGELNEAMDDLDDGAAIRQVILPG